jgi:hypothetical protein
MDVNFKGLEEAENTIAAAKRMGGYVQSAIYRAQMFRGRFPYFPANRLADALVRADCEIQV